MLAIGPHTRIYLFPGHTDMRKSFDGLRSIVEQSPIERLPQCGHLFGFSNKRRNMAKFLYWDGSGFWVSGKRLQQGTFWWPSPPQTGDTVEVFPEQLSALLSGISVVVDQTQRRNWQRIRPAA